MQSGTDTAKPLSCTAPSFYFATDTGILYVCNAPNGSTGVFLATQSSNAGLSSSVSPIPLSFGTVQIGSPQTLPVTFQNTGSANLLITSATIPSSDFSLPSPVVNVVVTPGASISITVVFNPSAAGFESQTLTIKSSAGTTAVPLSGTGTAGTTFALTIAGAPGGSGSVQSGDGTSPCPRGQTCVPPTINCSILSGVASPASDCGNSYPSGTVVVLTPAGSGQDTFNSFTIAGTPCANPCSVTMTANTTVVAGFTAATMNFVFSVTGVDQGIGTIASADGGIDCTSTAGVLSGSCSASYPQGTVLSLTATPSASCTGGSCTFASLNNGCTVSPCSVTVNSTTSVSADFAQPAAGAPLTLVQTIAGGSSGGSSLTFVHACQGENSSAATSLTITCSIAAGDAAIILAGEGSSQAATFTVSDSAGKTWTQTTGGYGNAGGSTAIRRGMFYMANSAALTSVTINYSASVTKSQGVILEFSGAAAASLEDASAANVDSANLHVTTLTSGALTTTNAADVLIYGIQTDGLGGGFTAASGYTIPTNGQTILGMAQYKIVAGTQTGTTTSPTWVTGVAAGGSFTALKGAAASNTVIGNWASAQNAGDVNVCYGLWNDATTTVSSIVDTKSNTYTQFGASPKTITGLTLVAYHADNILAATAGANTVTMTLSASPSIAKLNCVEYAGAIASPFDTSAGATGTSTAVNSGTLTTAGANEQLIGADNVAGTITAISPNFTQRILVAGNDVEDRLATTVGVYGFTPTQSPSGNWAAIIAALKTSGNPTTITVNLAGSGTGNGQVTSPSGLNCNISAGVTSGVCSLSVQAGSTIPVTAAPSNGSSFTSYLGGGCSSSPSCLTAAITSSTTIRATFSLPTPNGPYTVLQQQPPASRPYPGAYYNKKLPGAGSGGPLGHLMANSAAIVSTVMQNGGSSLVTGSGFWNSPGSDDGQHRAFYWGQSTDPVYRVSGCGFGSTTLSVNGQSFHAHSQSPYNRGSFDEEFADWDQTSNMVFQFYAGDPATFPTALPACSGNINSPCNFTHNGNQYCSAMNYSTGSGIDAGSGASTAGLAPMGNIIRLTEILNAGHINHGLRAVLACSDTNNGAYPSRVIFPANYATIAGQQSSGGPGQTCAAAGVSSTNRPPNGTVFFLDYTTAQLACFDPSQAPCGGINKLLSWQYMLIEAATYYGITAEDTGNGSSVSLPGIESEQGYLFADANGYPGAGAIANQFTNYMNANCPASGDPRCSVTNRCPGTGGSAVCANGHSQWQWNLNGWAGISNVGGTGIMSHMHVADPCVIVALQGLPNDGKGTNACP